ncbi:TetR/AcrR family transcriptional regulator [Actinoalloteichus hymeniacidonis]|uniref:TetR/AcrR family transcriptional regulator n=1 Tax=Actinoalloteichus hymeniacidonis TaxID=340345 RepID=UPI00155F82E0|nr:TetR/AcrR family transcriptional regulator [Actinoalloteichus hymeniacidonis]MBB5906338.1 AcrR family transcriptional regulator [Actinoalloteichus hymeniacidonis]
MTSTTGQGDQRREIGAALLRLVADGGIDAVSMRAVAAEAEVSLGMVQRRFTNKDALLLFTYRECIAAMAQRITDAVTQSLQEPLLQILRATVIAVLPTDRTRRTEWRFIIAFGERFGRRPEIAEMIAHDDAISQHDILGLLTEAQRLGQIPTGHDLVGAAQMVRTVVEGLTMSLLHRDDVEGFDIDLRSLDTALKLLTATPAPD